MLGCEISKSLAYLGSTSSAQCLIDPNTLPETNSLPLKMMVSNRHLLFQVVVFRSKLLVSGRVLPLLYDSNSSLNPSGKQSHALQGRRVHEYPLCRVVGCMSIPPLCARRSTFQFSK